MSNTKNLPDDTGPLLQGLNPQQLQAVVHRGPALLVVAGAGSGKTRVLTHRIAHLIHSGDAWPSQILAITFTNKAAGEMRERIRELLGEEAGGMWISTFHSACVRILRAEHEAFGYPQGFSIYDTADSRALLKRILKGLDADQYNLTAAKALSRISKLKNELADYEDYAANAKVDNPAEAVFVAAFRQYSQELARARAFDFDDLIAQTVQLFRRLPLVAAKYQRRFRHILVDEYQDTNHAQYALIRELTKPIEPEEVLELSDQGQYVAKLIDENGYIPGASLTVVGDSDQSIYAFRGADIRNIVEFERDFPGAQTVLLEQNYRSSQNILDAANAVIQNNFDRKAKNLWSAAGKGEDIIGFTGYSGHDEAQFVADRIEELHRAGHPYSEMAVFYRTNSQTRALEDILIRSAVPYRIVGGTKFYERAEIKDMMAYLTLAVNPADEQALRRIINLPKRGIGPATETAIASYASNNIMVMAEALNHAADIPGLGPKLITTVSQLGEIVRESAKLALAKPAHEVLLYVLAQTGYLEQLKQSKDAQQEARAENVEELVAVTREFHRNNPDSSALDFLTDAALVAAADDLDDTSGTVSLMTLHTAKGLEYDVVFITGIEEGLLPHQISVFEPGGIQEERRLFYVGITRAREILHLSLAATRASYAGVAPAMASRFLDEVPSQLVRWQSRPGAESALGRAASTTGYNSGNSFGSKQLAPSQNKPKTAWHNPVTKSTLRDNSALELAVGDTIRHSDFGQGRVVSLKGEGAKRIAEVQFAEIGLKKLLVNIAPIEKV